MSFDLAVWRSESVPSDSDAREFYLALCNDECGGDRMGQGVDEFYADLIRRYPEIDKYPEERVDQCLWSVQLNVSGTACIMSAVWSRSDEILAVVLELAKKYDLVVFDPQQGKVLLPKKAPKKVWLDLSDESN